MTGPVCRPAGFRADFPSSAAVLLLRCFFSSTDDGVSVTADGQDIAPRTLASGISFIEISFAAINAKEIVGRRGQP